MTLRLEKVGFQREAPVLQELDLQLAAGTLTILTGDSGCGKSTLLRMIAGFAPIDYTGRIFLSGQDYRNCSMAEKARQVGMVFQNPSQQFTMGTLQREIYFALENLNLPTQECQQRFQRAVELAETENLLSRKLNTLSGGEKQRAALTILLALDPPILLLDEPFASVDVPSRRSLIKKLAQLRDQGKTILLVDHDLADYDGVADQLLVLQAGQLQKLPLDHLQLPPVELGNTNTASVTAASFQLAGVTCQRGKKILLAESDWQFAAGITTLLGANGSGKSTLLRSMVQRHPYQGKMFYQQQRVRPRKKLYQTMTLAVQDAIKQFVGLTPAAEFSFSPQQLPHAAAKQAEALEVLGLAEKQQQSLYQLSEGQKKMVQLISLLSLDLKFLLLDEPFTGLDEGACTYFTDWIKERASQQDFLIVSHRLAPLATLEQQPIVLQDQRLQLVSSV